MRYLPYATGVALNQMVTEDYENFHINSDVSDDVIHMSMRILA
jgi:hypothetical protein